MIDHFIMEFSNLDNELNDKISKDQSSNILEVLVNPDYHEVEKKAGNKKKVNIVEKKVPKVIPKPVIPIAPDGYIPNSIILKVISKWKRNHPDFVLANLNQIPIYTGSDENDFLRAYDEQINNFDDEGDKTKYLEDLKNKVSKLKDEKQKKELEEAKKRNQELQEAGLFTSIYNVDKGPRLLQNNKFLEKHFKGQMPEMKSITDDEDTDKSSSEANGDKNENDENNTDNNSNSITTNNNKNKVDNKNKTKSSNNDTTDDDDSENNENGETNENDENNKTNKTNKISKTTKKKKLNKAIKNIKFNDRKNKNNKGNKKKDSSDNNSKSTNSSDVKSSKNTLRTLNNIIYSNSSFDVDICYTEKDIPKEIEILLENSWFPPELVIKY